LPPFGDDATEEASVAPPRRSQTAGDRFDAAVAATAVRAGRKR
jgi:hypothetical protein